MADNTQIIKELKREIYQLKCKRTSYKNANARIDEALSHIASATEGLNDAYAYLNTTYASKRNAKTNTKIEEVLAEKQNAERQLSMLKTEIDGKINSLNNDIWWKERQINSLS